MCAAPYRPKGRPAQQAHKEFPVTKVPWVHLVQLVALVFLVLLALVVGMGCPVHPDHLDPKARADPQALPEEVVPGF